MTEMTTWVPHRDGGVMVDVEFLETAHGGVHEGREMHLCPDTARAELWALEWRRWNPRFAVTAVRFTPVSGRAS